MRVRTIENPIIKDRVTFVRTTEETGGEFSEVLVELSPGGGTEPHFHTLYSESFTPIEGRLGVLVERDRRLLEPGETVTVPPGLVHCFFNPSEHVVRFKGEARPGYLGQEHFVQIAYGLARDGYVNKKGYPNRLSHIALLMEMGDVRIPGPTFRLFGPVLRLLASRARRRGVERDLLERYCA